MKIDSIRLDAGLHVARGGRCSVVRSGDVRTAPGGKTGAPTELPRRPQGCVCVPR